MFDEERSEECGSADQVQVRVPTPAQDRAAHVGDDWRAVDRQVRRLAARRSALDAEEARLLVIARRLEIHKRLGFGSFDEYLERALGYAPTTGRDRVRVAEALEALPETRLALAEGTVSFSTVRELTRVATPATEVEWLTHASGLTVREVEQSVRGRRRGDRPTERPDPDLEPRILRMEVPPQTYALFLDARRRLEKEVGHPMSDAEFLAVACRAVLGGGATDDGTPRTNLPPHQVAIVVCDECKRGWQDVPGRSVELSSAAIARASCDAVELGRVDDTEQPRRRKRTIAPRIRKAVLARDRHRCTVPGCTSSSFVDVHHIRHREDGGDDRMSNLTALCELHHMQHHDGVITIAGAGGAIRVTHADGRPYGTPPPPARAKPDAPLVGSPPVAPAVATDRLPAASPGRSTRQPA
ncbi:MAG: HNH endonuclease, partial [Deltaproteobacteria bacterium]|nr:HNH endonuclease [Kofleriaceae bacterium]